MFWIDPDGMLSKQMLTDGFWADTATDSSSSAGHTSTFDSTSSSESQSSNWKSAFKQIGEDLENMDTSLDGGDGNCCPYNGLFPMKTLFQKISSSLSEDVGLSNDAINSLGNKIPDYVIKAILSTKPVAYSLELTGASEAIGASSMSPWGGVFITAGPDIGKYKNFTSLGLGAGWISSSAMAVGYKYYYLGNVRNFSMETVEGWGNNLSLSGGAGAAVGLNLSWVENQKAPGEYLIGIGGGLGVGVGPTIISGQATRQMNKIHW